MSDQDAVAVGRGTNGAPAGTGAGGAPAGTGAGGAPAGTGAGGAAAGKPGRTFEQLLSELEEITDRLAGGDLGIETAADLYERAERLHDQAATRLAQVQERVERLRNPLPQSRP